jgi:pyruvate/2-oxoglutarate dehydrogenase complex dihydrolipoamide acyltransferase (E2) component
VKADVENFVAPAPAVATPVIAPTSVAQSVPVASGVPSQTTYGKLPVGDHVEIQDISKLRAKIAERMVLSQATSATLLHHR